MPVSAEHSVFCGFFLMQAKEAKGALRSAADGGQKPGKSLFGATFKGILIAKKKVGVSLSLLPSVIPYSLPSSNTRTSVTRRLTRRDIVDLHKVCIPTNWAVTTTSIPVANRAKNHHTFTDTPKNCA